MFSALQRKYHWVQRLVVYKTEADLVRRLRKDIVPRAARLAKNLQFQKQVMAAALSAHNA
jgi:hypothetical protein